MEFWKHYKIEEVVTEDGRVQKRYTPPMTEEDFQEYRKEQQDKLLTE